MSTRNPPTKSAFGIEMLLETVCTFLCLDAAGWTALATMALVFATVFLWLSQRADNDRSRQMFEQLNRPIVFVSDVTYAPHVLADRVGTITIVLRNEGATIAEGSLLTVVGSFDKNNMLSNYIESPELLTIYPKKQTHKELPISRDEHDHIVEGNDFYILVRLRYSRSEEEDYAYEQVSVWEALNWRATSLSQTNKLIPKA